MSDIKAQNQTALASVKAIYDAADEANTLLDGMNAAAQAAGTTLDGIYADAVQAASQAQAAQASASNASEYAARALGNLSTVQNVTETLNWITAHGTMTLTSDVALDPTHVYFVRDNNGDYHVGSYYYSVVTEPDVADIATYYELSIDESLNNYVATHLAVDSEGLWIIPDSGGNKVLIAVGGTGHTYNPAGTYVIGKVNNVDTVLASFTAGGAMVGNEDGAHTIIDEDGMQVYAADYNNNLVELANIGYGEGNSEGGTATAPYYTFGLRARTTNVYSSSTTYDVGDLVLYGNPQKLYVCISQCTGIAPTDRLHWQLTIGSCSVAEGIDTTASGEGSHTEGYCTTASGISSHAEGAGKRGDNSIGIIASGFGSHAEGMTQYVNSTAIIMASGDGSHAEGSTFGSNNILASGIGSHAEGTGTTASGNYSHAEGGRATASGAFSHAEGADTTASGNYSHAQNRYTIAAQDNQTAIGKYNDNQPDTAFEIGNGISSQRSNALTVDWDGNSEQAGHATTKDMTTQEVQDFVDGLDVSGQSIDVLMSEFIVNTLQSFSVSAIAANTVVSGSVNISKTGYSPIGIIGYSVEGTAATLVNVARMRVHHTNKTVDYQFRNTSSSATGALTVYVEVLWLKNVNV